MTDSKSRLKRVAVLKKSGGSMADETEVHYLEKAWREWIASEEGQKCYLGTATGEYLMNRLWRAFMAGAEAEAAMVEGET